MSSVNLCSNVDDRLQIYRDNFERAYLEATDTFYKRVGPEYLLDNGVQNFMKFAENKLKEEEMRAQRYLEICKGSNSKVALSECCVQALVSSFKEEILRECAPMIKSNETEKLHLMFRLMDRVPDGINPMLRDLEHHIMEAGLADMVAAADIITSDSEKYVEQLLELFTRFSTLVRDAFNDDPRFLTSRDKVKSNTLLRTLVSQCLKHIPACFQNILVIAFQLLDKQKEERKSRRGGLKWPFKTLVHLLTMSRVHCSKC